MTYGKTIRIFAERDLYQELRRREQQIKSEVERQPDNYILNVNETEYVNSLVNQYKVEPVVFQFDKVTVDTYEKSFPLRGERALLSMSEGGEIKHDVYRFHVPFIGDSWLLSCKPNECILWTIDVQMREQCIAFDVVASNVSSDNTIHEVQSQKNQTLSRLKTQSEFIATDIQSFARSLPNSATTIFKDRKDHLLKKHNTLAALGVPIRSNEEGARTFAIPAPQQRAKINVTPPIVSNKDFKPDPTLDDGTYQKILKAIHDVGQQLERMPSTYRGKSEEDLRDIILVHLEPQFTGSATGETFNKAGKTDILLRHEGKNAFIAECKFWKGIKGFSSTITQLLSYLTWRDSKSAIIIFVQNKDLSSVIANIESEIHDHANYIGFVSKQEETWLNYRFHINGDRNREVKLAVLLFHVPE